MDPRRNCNCYRSIKSKSQGLGFVSGEGNGGLTRELGHPKRPGGPHTAVTEQPPCSHTANAAYPDSSPAGRGSGSEATWSLLTLLGPIWPLSRELGQTYSCSCTEDMHHLVRSCFPQLWALVLSCTLVRREEEEEEWQLPSQTCTCPSPSSTLMAAPHGTLDCL